MSETKGARETIDRMTRNIVKSSNGQVTPDQAKRLEKALTSKSIPAKAYGAQNTTHSKINADLGLPDDPSTTELLSFLKSVLN